MPPLSKGEPHPSSEVYLPAKAIQERAHLGSMEAYRAMYDRSIQDPEGFWEEQARKELDWFHPFTKVRKFDGEWGQAQWFLNGRLNVCHNCVDRHASTRGDQTAIIWESD